MPSLFFYLMSIPIDLDAKVADFLHSDFMTSLIPNDCQLQGNKYADNYSLRERGKECRGNNPSYLSFYNLYLTFHSAPQ